MNLTARKRAEETKGAIKRARREGKIPAIFYSSGKPGLPIEVDGVEFQTALRKVEQNHLSTTIFVIDLDGKKRQAIVKGIQYNIRYDVIHLDFQELHDDATIEVKVPVECIGVADCAGIKLGGALRQIIRSVKVKCLPKHIPSSFQLNVAEMKLNQALRLSDLSMPVGVKPIASTDEVVVVIAKR